MDRISGLPDELLLKVLSFLPTKVAVSTSILSKRWEFLRMWLPKLEYTDLQSSEWLSSSRRYASESECKRLRCFLHKNLPLHRALVIESLRLQFRFPHIKPEDIKLWSLIAVSRFVRELEISYSSFPNQRDVLPSSLYTCKSLVTLKLIGTILVDVPPMVCLPSLKTLRLERLTYYNEDSLQRLLSNCPVLEDLSVAGYNMKKLIVIVPSLQRLTFYIRKDLDEFVINTPSLNYLKLHYQNPKSLYCLIENMPKLKEASVSISFPFIESLIGSITSVKHLTLCLSSEALYGDGFVFKQLEHLKLCICEDYAPNVLVRLLQDSPNLRVLDLLEMEGHAHDGINFWNQPSTVPECMLSSLQTFKWSGYLGRPEERDLVKYILENAGKLKTATILSAPDLFQTLDMLKELAFSSRASPACHLVFV